MLTEKQIDLAYHLLLGRAPRPEELNERLAALLSPRDLTEALLASDELRERQDRFQPHMIRVPFNGRHPFDFLIADPTAEAWYNGWGSWYSGGPEMEWCLARIESGMTVLDCGAHHGMFAIAFAQAVGSTGCLLAWEAWPKAATVLEWNLALNGYTDARVRPVALGDPKSGAQFYVGDETVFASADTDLPCTTLPIVGLDDDLPPGTRVDFIKIDVEGSELDVLRGGRNTLSQRPRINLEIHNFIYPDREAVLGRIEEILRPLEYYYWVQEVPDFGEVGRWGRRIDLERLARLDNPHLFCEPL